MSSIVRVLNDALVDKIAAGEVVDRPASAVKELLENAVDAGARRVSVDINEGGRDLIRVVDDGHGMTPEDAALCVRRHATSKIRSAEDLNHIGTLGFRGEALPSIASVSRFSLTTRTRDAQAGTLVQIDGGENMRVSEVGAAPGTKVEVRDLFFNVPARRKFLKARQTESSHVGDICLRVALSDPGLSLRLTRDKKLAREFLPQSTLLDRLHQIYDEAQFQPVEVEKGKLKVVGYLDPTKRPNSRQLFIYVNGRTVNDRALTRAVSFGAGLHQGGFPRGVLRIELPLSDVDVNVHPRKLEVRFPRGDTLDRISQMIAGRFNVGGPAARGGSYWDRRLNSPSKSGDSQDAKDGDHWGIGAALRESKTGYSTSETPSPAPSAHGHADSVTVGGANKVLPALPQESAGYFASLVWTTRLAEFALCQDPQGWCLVDLHAAVERVAFHALRTSETIASTALVFPERVQLAKESCELAESLFPQLREAGYECTRIAEDRIGVHTVATNIAAATAAEIISVPMLKLLQEGNHDSFQANAACMHASNYEPSDEEAQQLLHHLDSLPSQGALKHVRLIAQTTNLAALREQRRRRIS